MSTDAGLRVLLIEDDFAIRNLLRERLHEHGLTVQAAEHLARARELLAGDAVDLILLDLGLPDGDGINFIAELRRWSDLPVLVLSARSQERDKIAALDAGADDYLSKPFTIGELLARTRAISRRARIDRREPVLTAGELQIDFAQRRISRAGQQLHLTPIEFRLLSLLAGQPGRVLTYKHLLAEGWSTQNPDLHHYVRIVIGHLRRKLEIDPAQPRHLLTETGIGYRWQS